MPTRKRSKNMAEETKSKSTDGKKPDSVHETALERFKECVDREASDRLERLNDLRFVTLDQWPSDVRRSRENDPNGARPCLTIDKVGQYRNQIINSIRKNRPAVKVRPVDDGSDVETAKVMQGIVRHIEDISNSDVAYENASEQAIDTGAGYWRYLTQVIDEEKNQQEIYIKQIPDTFSVYLSLHYEPDGSDCEYGFIIEDVPRETFKRKWPKAKAEPSEFDGVNGYPKYWGVDEGVRVCEYFWFDYAEDGTHRVRWRKMTAIEVLEEGDWAGKFIPIVEVIGTRKTVDGKTKTWGIVRPAIDSARMYNYWASTITERLALSPKVPYVGAKGQFDGMEDRWKTANSVSHAYLEYDAIDVNGQVLPPPQRTAPAQIEAAMIQQLSVIEHDIQTSLGMFKASVGEQTRDQSGRAIRALQSQSDTATFHFPDNLARSVRFGGRILVDLIPKIYDSARIVRIIGEDGIPSTAKLNPQIQMPVQSIKDETGAIRKIYNLGMGRYDVAITSGPSYSTRRMEAADQMGEVLQTNPQLLSVIGDLYFRSIDGPYSEQIADRLHKMLPPQLQGGDNPQQPQIPPQVQQQIEVMKQGMQKLLAENQQLKSGQQESQQKLQLKAHEVQSELQLQAQKQAEEARLAQEKLAQDSALARAKAEAEIQLKAHIAHVEGTNAERDATFEQVTQAMPQIGMALQALGEQFALLTQTVKQGEQAEAQQIQLLAKKIDDTASANVAMTPIKDASGNIIGAHAKYADGRTRTLTIH